MIGRRGRPQYRAVVRFSVFDPDWYGWRATNSGVFATPEAYRDYLWSAQRMEPRFWLFGGVALPIHQRMAQGHDYRVLVQHSSQLPTRWLERLQELQRTFPVLRLVPVRSWVEARDTVHEDLRQHGRSGPVVMLRLDDDDVLGADFLDLLAPHVSPTHDGWCVSLGAGVTAWFEGRRLTDFRELDQPFSSVGQAYIGHYLARKDDLALSHLVSHRHVHKSRPTIVDSRSRAFLQVRHARQDSHVGQDPKKARELMLKRMAAMHRVTDFAGLRTRFPSLSEALDRAEAAQRS
jgi:hypothetical protein